MENLIYLLLIPLTLLGAAIYRARGADSPLPKLWSKIVGNLLVVLFAVPLVVIAFLVSGQLWSLLLFLPLWWSLEQFGHGTVYIDKYYNHAPLRKRERNGTLEYAVHGEKDYHPWYIRYAMIFPPKSNGWDSRWGMFILGLYATIIPAAILFFFGEFILGLIVLFSAIAKPLAYYIGWKFSSWFNWQGTWWGEVLYGALSWLPWCVVAIQLWL